MALSTKLIMRQGQSLVMTPQLLQAIKLLQFSNLELAAFVQEELERNPMLERAEDLPAPHEIMANDGQFAGDIPNNGDFNEASDADWSSDTFATDRGALEASLGTELSNAFEDDRIHAAAEHHDAPDSMGLSATSWSGSSSPSGDGEIANLEAYVAAELGLKDHLAAQLALVTTNAIDRMIGHALIDSIDDSGYLTEEAGDIAERLGTSTAAVENILEKIQTFDPCGVGARNLAECLSIQLRERDRFDPAMQTLVAHLDLLGKRDLVSLRKLCGVDEEDMIDMVAEIRRLDPRPGRAFGGAAIQPVVPDVMIQISPNPSKF